MDTVMTGHDPFERDLERMLAARPAPEALRRQIAAIPMQHPRPARSTWRGWLASWSGGTTMPWAASMTAGFASLAIGIWLGLSGVSIDNDGRGNGGGDELASMAFPGANMMGDDL